MVHTQHHIDDTYQKSISGKHTDCKSVRPEEHEDVVILTFYEDGEIYIYRRELSGEWQELPRLGTY